MRRQLVWILWFVIGIQTLQSLTLINLVLLIELLLALPWEIPLFHYDCFFSLSSEVLLKWAVTNPLLNDRWYKQIRCIRFQQFCYCDCAVYHNHRWSNILSHEHTIDSTDDWCLQLFWMSNRSHECSSACLQSFRCEQHDVGIMWSKLHRLHVFWDRVRTRM